MHETSVSSIHESSVSLMQESNNSPTSGLMQKSLLNEKTINKTPSWFKQFEELKNEQLNSAKENAKQLNDRLVDKYYIGIWIISNYSAVNYNK